MKSHILFPSERYLQRLRQVSAWTFGIRVLRGRSRQPIWFYARSRFDHALCGGTFHSDRNPARTAARNWGRPRFHCGAWRPGSCILESVRTQGFGLSRPLLKRAAVSHSRSARMQASIARNSLSRSLSYLSRSFAISLAAILRSLATSFGSYPHLVMPGN